MLDPTQIKISKIYSILKAKGFRMTRTIYRNKQHNRKWQDYVYIQCEYKSTKQKIKHLLREENKVKENKIS